MKSMVKAYTLFICCFAMMCCYSQNQRFRPVLSLGLVGSQVDGDTYSGYNKSGLMAGLGVNHQLGEKMEFELAITYIQKGARKNSNPAKGDLNYYLFRLHYVEVPLMFKYNYKKIKLEAGLSYAYLFSYSEENAAVGYYTTNPPLHRDVSYDLGCGYKISDNFLVNLRYSYSMLPIRPYSGQNVYYGNLWNKMFNKGLDNNLLVLSLNYLLNPAKD